ncbi:MAG: DUF4381 domain-containing protein [Verrucomicrobiota bacterium]
MKDDPASLQNLHDVVSPAAVSWWPLASGWYFVGAFVLIALVWQGWRRWRSWRASAYRRAALEELAEAHSSLDVATILRRTALAVAEREEVADRSGSAWIEWLEAALPGSLEAGVREQLVEGIYRSRSDTSASEPLRAYAARWIRFHSVVGQSGENVEATLTK